MKFNGSHNGMAKNGKIPANGLREDKDVEFNNGAPQAVKA